jgi:hypothetical protein
LGAFENADRDISIGRKTTSGTRKAIDFLEKRKSLESENGIIPPIQKGYLENTGIAFRPSRDAGSAMNGGILAGR